MDEEQNKQKHQRVIGLIFIILGTLLLVVSIVALNIYLLGPDIFGFDLPPEITLGFITIHNPFKLLILIPIFYASIGIFDLLVGLGILQHKIWGQKLALIAAFFIFFSFPLGTAMCFYIFYAFLNEDILRRFGIKGNSIEMGH